MYIRLIDSTLGENEYLFRLNDQQKVYCIICGYDVTGAGFENKVRFRPIRKEKASSMYNNKIYHSEAAQTLNTINA